jgi:large subunit ribosomal protein L4
MATLPVSNISGKKVEELNISGALAEFKPNKQAVHDYIVMYNYNRRNWSANTKNRKDVKCSSKKPWRQKGTGRARAGRLSSPLFRGGGVVFGPKPKDVYYNLPKKIRRLAFKSAIVERLQNERIFIVDDLKIDQPKTKEVVAVLKNLKAEGKTLVVLKDPGKNAILSMRNLDLVTLRRTDNINAYDIVANTNLVLTKESYDELLRMVGDEGSA